MSIKTIKWPDLSAHGLTLLSIDGSPRSFALAPLMRDAKVSIPDDIAEFFKYDKESDLWLALPKDGQPVRFPSLNVWMKIFPAGVIREITFSDALSGLQTHSVRYHDVASICDTPVRATWVWCVNIEENDARDMLFFVNEIEAQGQHPDAVASLVDADEVNNEIMNSLEIIKSPVPVDQNDETEASDDEQDMSDQDELGKRHDAGRFVPGNHKDRYTQSLIPSAEFLDMNASLGMIPMHLLKERFKIGRFADVFNAVDTTQSLARKKFMDFASRSIAPSLLSTQGYRHESKNALISSSRHYTGIKEDFTDLRRAEKSMQLHEDYITAITRIESLANMIPDGADNLPFDVIAGVLFDPLFNNGRQFMTKAQSLSHGDFLPSFLRFSIGEKVSSSSVFGFEDRKKVYNDIEGALSNPVNHWMIEGMNAFMHEHIPQMAYDRLIHPCTVAIFMTAFFPFYDIDKIIKSGLSTEDNIQYSKYISRFIFDDIQSLIGVTSAMILGDQIQSQYKQENKPVSLAESIRSEIYDIKYVFKSSEASPEKFAVLLSVTQLVREIGVSIQSALQDAITKQGAEIKNESSIVQDAKIETPVSNSEDTEDITPFFDTSILQGIRNIIEKDVDHEKEFKNIRALYEISRTGRPSARGDRNVSESEFMENFALSAVVYGNSMPEKERQEHINLTYDALMDMSLALDIHPNAMGLPQKMFDGSYRPLAIAFASRGRGKAAAHYESGQHVINLTRNSGAGFLAHEWGHAFLSCVLASQTNGRIKSLRDAGSAIDYSMHKIVQTMYSQTMLDHVSSNINASNEDDDENDYIKKTSVN